MLTIKTATLVVALAAAALCGGAATLVVVKAVGDAPLDSSKCELSQSDKAFFSGKNKGTGADKEY